MTSSIVIFVVEDEQFIRDVLEAALTDGGFTVAFANNGEDAVVKLDIEGADYSALITDINLGGELSGWAVAKRAREINDKLPVIYITADSGHEWGSRGVPNSQLLVKPFAMAQIVTAVAHLMNATAAD